MKIRGLPLEIIMKKICFTFCLAVALFLFQQPVSAKASETNLQVKVVSPEEKVEKTVPRIDDEAASIVKEDKVEKPISVKAPEKRDNVYSQNFWMLLFGFYLFLLIFNLSFEFGKKKKLQWFWEAVFTFLAIYVWDNLDVTRLNTWFPGVVLESGIVIYAFYFYFLDKEGSKEKKE